MKTKMYILLILLYSRYSHHYLRAQESCYEQYFREHNKKILTAEDADDSTYVIRMEGMNGTIMKRHVSR